MRLKSNRTRAFHAQKKYFYYENECKGADHWPELGARKISCFFLLMRFITITTTRWFNRWCMCKKETKENISGEWRKTETSLTLNANAQLVKSPLSDEIKHELLAWRSLKLQTPHLTTKACSGACRRNRSTLDYLHKQIIIQFKWNSRFHASDASHMSWDFTSEGSLEKLLFYSLSLQFTIDLNFFLLRFNKFCLFLALGAFRMNAIHFFGYLEIFWSRENDKWFTWC